MMASSGKQEELESPKNLISDAVVASYVDWYAEILEGLGEKTALVDEEVIKAANAIIREVGATKRGNKIDKSRKEGKNSGKSSGKNWRNDPASEKQKAKMDELQIPYGPEITKGEASDKLDKAFSS
jgi:hypothetical protein